MYGPIIFSAYKTNGTATFTPGMNITEFTGFLSSDEDANNFTLSNGIFLAPRNGIYEFSASIYHNKGGANTLAILKNGEEILLISDNETGTNGNNWIIELQKGDQVQLQVKAGQFTCNKGNNCIFNGKIIRDITY